MRITLSSDESEEETLENLFEDEQPPSIDEEPTRPKRARKPPEKFNNFICQAQPDTVIRRRHQSREPAVEPSRESTEDEQEDGATSMGIA